MLRATAKLRAMLLQGRTMSSAQIVHLLYAARCLRGSRTGVAVITLPAYLSALGFNPIQIGLVAAASLFGTAVFTLLIGLIAPRHDLRNMLLLGAALMAVTGIAFPSCEHLILIAAVSFIGTINPSTGDIGVLVPLEHALLARSIADEERTRTFARYSLIGALSMAAGALAAGMTDILVARVLSNLAAFKLMFYLYAVLGLVAAAVYQRLPRSPAEPSRPVAPLGPSRHVVYKLAALFSVDAFAGGFVVQSLLALWLFEKFELSLTAASLFFFWSGVLSAFSYPVAARIAGRIGLINTMVFTHIPSSVCLIAAAFSPDLPLALGLLLVRSALANGRPDADILRDGGGDPRRTNSRRERDRGAAQPGLLDQSGIRRHAPDASVCGTPARVLRKLENHLRPRPIVFVSTHQTAGGKGIGLCRKPADRFMKLIRARDFPAPTDEFPAPANQIPCPGDLNSLRRLGRRLARAPAGHWNRGIN